jgi:hypothetical protein
LNHIFNTLDSKGVPHTWQIRPLTGGKAFSAIQIFISLGVGDALLKILIDQAVKLENLRVKLKTENPDIAPEELKDKVDELRSETTTSIIDYIELIQPHNLLNTMLTVMDTKGKSLEDLAFFFIKGGIRDGVAIETSKTFDSVFGDNNILEAFTVLEEVFSINSFLSQLVTYIQARFSQD